MRILHLVEFYEPVKGGAQEVVRQLSERLARRGHEVTVATSAVPERSFDILNGVRIVEFALSGNSVRGIKGDPGPLLNFITAGGFDVIMSYAAQTWHMDLLLANLERIESPVVLAACGFSALHDPDYRGYFDYVADRARNVRAVVLHSDSYRDATFLRCKGLRNLTVIPNGAGEEFANPAGRFRERHRIPSGRALLLTVGSHTGMKGHLETVAAVRRARIGAATLIINGNTLPGGHGCLPRCIRRARTAKFVSLGRKDVRLLDLPRPELIDAFHAADLFVFLSRIECAPLVLYEACASGLPFVTADVGNAAQIARDTGAGVVVRTTRDGLGNSIADITDAAGWIECLLADAAQRRAMGERGLEAWRTRYHWDLIASRYERLYRNELDADQFLPVH